MTVLVGYLPTARGEAAFAAALEEARRRGEDLVVLNTPRSGASVSTDAVGDEAVSGLRSRAAEAGIPLHVRRQAHEGDAADELLRVADEVDASVVVIALRRRSSVGKLLMGSTAQRVLLAATRPVLAVRAPAAH
ncbi:universal stress protein [uncultured Pseudokineococcus sp.]|uniref:universal stress protein n=1 Tax=uncultured Pseudokineococcus sp. TaxID=1642928 RepID=UPI00261BFD81|nr:universal stress protein [uncultured Pseudokineococcus sp.]